MAGARKTFDARMAELETVVRRMEEGQLVSGVFTTMAEGAEGLMFAPDIELDGKTVYHKRM